MGCVCEVLFGTLEIIVGRKREQTYSEPRAGRALRTPVPSSLLWRTLSESTDKWLESRRVPPRVWSGRETEHEPVCLNDASVTYSTKRHAFLVFPALFHVCFPAVQPISGILLYFMQLSPAFSPKTDLVPNGALIN